jgi:hypothetical protein
MTATQQAMGAAFGREPLAQVCLRAGKSALHSYPFHDEEPLRVVRVGADPSCEWQVVVAGIAPEVLRFTCSHGVLYFRASPGVGVRVNGTHVVDGVWLPANDGMRIDAGATSFDVAIAPAHRYGVVDQDEVEAAHSAARHGLEWRSELPAHDDDDEEPVFRAAHTSDVYPSIEPTPPAASASSAPAPSSGYTDKPTLAWGRSEYPSVQASAPVTAQESQPREQDSPRAQIGTQRAFASTQPMIAPSRRQTQARSDEPELTVSYVDTQADDDLEDYVSEPKGAYADTDPDAFVADRYEGHTTTQRERFAQTQPFYARKTGESEEDEDTLVLLPTTTFWPEWRTMRRYLGLAALCGLAYVGWVVLLDAL